MTEKSQEIEVHQQKLTGLKTRLTHLQQQIEDETEQTTTSENALTDLTTQIGVFIVVHSVFVLYLLHTTNYNCCINRRHRKTDCFHQLRN